MLDATSWLEEYCKLDSSSPFRLPIADLPDDLAVRHVFDLDTVADRLIDIPADRILIDSMFRLMGAIHSRSVGYKSVDVGPLFPKKYQKPLNDLMALYGNDMSVYYGSMSDIYALMSEYVFAFYFPQNFDWHSERLEATVDPDLPGMNYYEAVYCGLVCQDLVIPLGSPDSEIHLIKPMPHFEEIGCNFTKMLSSDTDLYLYKSPYLNAYTTFVQEFTFMIGAAFKAKDQMRLENIKSLSDAKAKAKEEIGQLTEDLRVARSVGSTAPTLEIANNLSWQ